MVDQILLQLLGEDRGARQDQLLDKTAVGTVAGCGG